MSGEADRKGRWLAACCGELGASLRTVLHKCAFKCEDMSASMRTQIHPCTHTLHAHLHPHKFEPHKKERVVSGPVWRAPLRPVL